MSKLFVELLKDESGASAIEYALLVAVIATGLVAAMGPMATAIANVWSNATTAVNSNVTP
jgi:pilus assembly protein Flp/PilA